jgi:predicted ester cyclase
MKSERKDLLAFYRRYLKRCNEHRFDELGEFVADDVNGPTEGLSRYIAGLRAVVEAFPDYQWELQRLVIDDQWLAARLYGTGTPHRPLPRNSSDRAGHPHAGACDLSNRRRQDC